ncbi:MAG: 16S rRNA (cytosine(1402)-N(4))-methyltransferase, partial [Fimbriimonadaceae bacterium]|nr:16S rRNA (cytosine(1402)-N(4))-methyltransferase [Alphaproteobacteria bacterium]
SLEDRIVKRFLTNATNSLPAPSRHMPMTEEVVMAPTFEPLFRGSHAPEDKEINANPRARSARLRAAIRTAAPARPLDLEKAGLPRLPALSQVSAQAIADIPMRRGNEQ